MDKMPFETKREYLEHLNDLIHSYPKREHVDGIKLFIGLEHVFVCLNIHDFDLNKNQDVWNEIRKGLAVHPLKNEG